MRRHWGVICLRRADSTPPLCRDSPADGRISPAVKSDRLLAVSACFEAVAAGRAFLRAPVTGQSRLYSLRMSA
ncbi:unnamed protein product, partial [Iphiclides podalirius]